VISAETYTQLVGDGPHIFFELTWELISAVVVYKITKPLQRRWKQRFHAELDSVHGIEHDDQGKAFDVNVLRDAYKSVVVTANLNHKAWEQEKDRADRLQSTLTAELRKNS
jgi:hypothetical protein